MDTAPAQYRDSTSAHWHFSAETNKGLGNVFLARHNVITRSLGLQIGATVRRVFVLQSESPTPPQKTRCQRAAPGVGGSAHDDCRAGITGTA